MVSRAASLSSISRLAKCWFSCHSLKLVLTLLRESLSQSRVADLVMLVLLATGFVFVRPIIKPCVLL